MTKYENYFTYQGCEYYLCTEYAFDHADQLQLSGFAMWRDGREVSQASFEANKGLYDIVCEILGNKNVVAVCNRRASGGTPQGIIYNPRLPLHCL
jgi:hypothetical protein